MLLQLFEGWGGTVLPKKVIWFEMLVKFEVLYQLSINSTFVDTEIFLLVFKLTQWKTALVTYLKLSFLSIAAVPKVIGMNA